MKKIRTKIVITIGKAHGKVYGPEGKFYPKDNPVPHEKLLEWLVDSEGNSMIDVIRLNMAHFTDGENEREVLKWLQKDKCGVAKNIAIIGDLPGPKIRLGNLTGSENLVRGSKFNLYWKGKPESDSSGASVLVYDKPFSQVGNYDQVAEYIKQFKKDVMISVGDGQVILIPQDENNGVVTCEVAITGEVKDGKGITIMGLDLPLPAMGPKDKTALDFLLSNALPFLAFIGVSFVKSKEDILRVKEYIRGWFIQNKQLSPEDIGRYAPAVIAKIETRTAYENENIDAIIDVADGIMVARGDLGLQFDASKVPAIQKDIIRKCNLRGKPVITATQMLDSMERIRRPTRAEATDVFNAILDGTDAVMLSGETAEGQFPYDSVRTMIEIAIEAEKYMGTKEFRKKLADDLLKDAEKQIKDFRKRATVEFEKIFTKLPAVPEPKEKKRLEWLRDLWTDKTFKNENQETTNLVSHAACLLAEDNKISAIITRKAYGRTARMLSRFRPRVNILAATYDDQNAKKLALSFGVYPFCIGTQNPSSREKFKNPDEVCEQAMEESVLLGYLKPGNTAVYVGGTPLMRPGTTNLIHIKNVESKDQDSPNELLAI